MTKYFNKDGVEFKVGDKVKVLSVGVSDDPNGMGPGVRYMNSWVRSMDDSVGKIFIIASITSNGVHFEQDYLGYPLNVLENLSTKKPAIAGEIEVGDLVRVICDQGSDAYKGKIGQEFTVSHIRVGGGYMDSRYDIITCEGVECQGQYRKRFVLVKKAKDIVPEVIYPTLIPFQRVKFRNGNIGIVVTAEEIVLERGRWVEVVFTGKNVHEVPYEITAVYDLPDTYRALDFSAKGVIVWESEIAKKELTEKIEAATAKVEETKAAFDKASVALHNATEELAKLK